MSSSLSRGHNSWASLMISEASTASWPILNLDPLVSCCHCLLNKHLSKMDAFVNCTSASGISIFTVTGVLFLLNLQVILYTEENYLVKKQVSALSDTRDSLSRVSERAAPCLASQLHDVAQPCTEVDQHFSYQRKVTMLKSKFLYSRTRRIACPVCQDICYSLMDLDGLWTCTFNPDTHQNSGYLWDIIISMSRVKIFAASTKRLDFVCVHTLTKRCFSRLFCSHPTDYI